MTSKKKNQTDVKVTRVFKVNDDQMVVADNITEAIDVYQSYYPDDIVRKIEQMYCGSTHNEDCYDAIMKEYQD